MDPFCSHFTAFLPLMGPELATPWPVPHWQSKGASPLGPLIQESLCRDQHRVQPVRTLQNRCFIGNGSESLMWCVLAFFWRGYRPAEVFERLSVPDAREEQV